jgi:hypothetical protein
LLAPVRVAGSWTIAENGSPIWDGRHVQLWNQRLSPDGERIAAVVAPSFGQWTVAVDDALWPLRISDLVLPPVFSPDSQRVAAAIRDQERWTMVVEGKVWPESFDMVWDPVFTPDSRSVMAKVERDGRFAVAIDGRVWSPWFEGLWTPVPSPDGKQVLIRCIEDGKYFRNVVSFDSKYAQE